MPEISRFLGILIYMYYREHAPPHFHAEYGEFEITVEIESGVVSGRFPRRGSRSRSRMERDSQGGTSRELDACGG